MTPTELANLAIEQMQSALDCANAAEAATSVAEKTRLQSLAARWSDLADRTSKRAREAIIRNQFPEMDWERWDKIVPPHSNPL